MTVLEFSSHYWLIWSGCQLFMTCHNAIWELAVDALAADLTDHVIPEAIVTPGIMATVLEFWQAGFH